MWLTCKFLLRDNTWEKRYEFFPQQDEKFLNDKMSEYLARNYAKYAGVIVCDGYSILCAIVQ